MLEGHTMEIVCITLLMLLLLLCGDVHPNPGPNVINSKNLNLCLLNVCSLLAPHRLDDLEDFVKVIHDFDLVALTETHIDPRIQDSSILLQSYNLFRREDMEGELLYMYLKNFMLVDE